MANASSATTYPQGRPTDVVNETDIRKFAVYLVVDTVGDGTAGFADDDVLLAHLALVDHRAYEGKSHERRGIEFDNEKRMNFRIM